MYTWFSIVCVSAKCQSLECVEKVWSLLLSWAHLGFLKSCVHSFLKSCVHICNLTAFGAALHSLEGILAENAEKASFLQMSKENNLLFL